MASANFVVTQVGPHTSIQDRGRPGLMRFGVPASGAMDRNAFQAANTALGNPSGCPTIEISLGGITLECESGSVTFAVTGGAFQTAIDAKPLGSWWVETIHAGSRLTIKPGFWGSWAYLAFAGELQATSWLGSVSTHGPSGLGGGKLAAGQKIAIETAEIRDERVGSVPCPVFARPRNALRVVLGPQDHFFTRNTIATLLSRPFALSDAYDRMGVRLNGPSLKPAAVLDMPSQAIVRGSIQIAGDGVPTVLLADHQTTGGYPKIATILSGDVDQFVQLRSRHWVTFDLVSSEKAIAIARGQNQVRKRYLQSLSERNCR
jgi:allophanate hydrolase